MASKETIANRALQKIGVTRISSLTEGSKNADEVNFCFDFLKDAELRANFWTFAIQRAALAADTETPISGRAYQYSLPGNFLRMAPEDPSFMADRREYLIEGRKIITDLAAPLYIRYVRNDVPEDEFDAMFADALAMRIAMEIAEPLTQSSSKREAAEQAYKYFIDLAKKTNAIEAGPIENEIDELVLVRISDAVNPALRKYSN